MVGLSKRRLALELPDNGEAIKAAKVLARKLGRSIAVINATTGERWDVPFIDALEN